MRSVKPAARIAASSSSGESLESFSVTSTSALKRGTPNSVTACAPKRYQRPCAANTGPRARSSSTAAGITATAQSFREPEMGIEVGGAILRGRPLRAKLLNLSAKLVRDPQRLQRTAQASDLGPVGVLGVSDGRPIAIKE